jgi:sarcosine oxidase, subunit delta
VMQLRCPDCGPRDESEFSCGGTTHISRPDLKASDVAWGEYLFFRDNPKGVHFERWRHTYGCGSWFNLARHTVTHQVLAVYRMSEAPPTQLPDGVP